MTAGAAGIPLKLSYGSDFPYRQVAGATSIVSEGADTRPSYACGGLSNVWGSAMLPYTQRDIADWPISIDDLKAGYRAVLGWMPVSAMNDALAEIFPLYTDRITSLTMSRQATSLLGDLSRSRAKLNGQGVYFGSSRLAVRASDSDARPTCVKCGLCMYGCPHDLIYSSERTLATLLSAGRLQYRPGITVQSVEETSGGVTLHAVNSQGAPLQIEAGRVYLAAGLLNTTAILLRSLGQYDRPVQIRDSQYFLLPLLRLRGTSGVVREPLHTLAQLFVEIFDTAISPYTIHLQTYTYNDLFRQAIIDKLDKMGSLKNLFPTEAFLGRLLLFQGYLHSSGSATIAATLKRNQEGDTLQLQAAINPETKRSVARVARKLMKLVPETGVVPLMPMLQMGKPGRGFHSGGSFPMSASPGEQETDILGRPAGWKRIHAVDSTVLPSIPATTITFTVMANAYRIGSLSVNEGQGSPV
jgi:choline dehydrogenase-like flavoprotein